MCIPSHKHSLLASKNSSDLNDLLEIDEMFGRNLWTNDNENENNNNNNNADNGDDEAPPQNQDPGESNEDHSECECNENLIARSLFYPPLSVQRYKHFCDTLHRLFGDKEAFEMADLGCSDFKLFNHLRHVPNLKNIKAVDIDTKKIDLKSLKPLAADYLCPKLHGMSLSILQGNLKFIDERLRNLDLICMIEVIEHMELCDVKEILRIIFLIYSPTYLYVTTPNRDFNKHFETLPAGEFRHPDHHYEFSSLEFSIWASEMSREFNYSYEIFGIGTLPESADGEFCSQGALFTITDQVKRIPKNIKFEDNFVAVYNKKFPAESQYTGNETELEETKVALRIKDALYETSKAYYLNELDYDAAKEKLSPEGSIKIPVSYIVENMKNIAMTSEELLAAIEKYEIVEYVKEDNCIIHDVNCFFEDDSEDYVNFT